MKRLLFNLLTALSLLLCVALVVLWARSLSVADSFVTDRWLVTSVGAAVRVKHHRRPAHFFGADRRRWRSDPADALEQAFWPVPGRRGSFSFAGFDYDTEPPPSRMVMVAVPHWALLLMAGLPLAARAWRRAKRRRLLLRRHCLHCGYDLRATPGRCPECGEPATADRTSCHAPASEGRVSALAGPRAGCPPKSPCP